MQYKDFFVRWRDGTIDLLRGLTEKEHKMAYRVFIDEGGAMVSVSVSGRAEKTEHLAARDEALRLCQEGGCLRLLVNLSDLDTEGISITNCFEFGESLARVTPRVVVANILPKNGKSRQDVLFTSTVASNRGLTSREFDTVEEAKSWLLSST